MKVILENFGPINRVEFDLKKDMNVIFGKNNIGKSYSITALYIILKHLLAEFGSDASANQHIQRLNSGSNLPRNFSIDINSINFSENELLLSPLEEAVRSIRATVSEVKDLKQVNLSTPLANLLRSVFSNALDDNLTNSFHNSFESVKGLINANGPALLSMTIKTALITIKFIIQDEKIILDDLRIVTVLPLISKDGLSRPDYIAENGEQLEPYFTVGSSRWADQGYLSGMLEVLFIVFRSELLTIANGVYFLPASRSGLYQALNNLSVLLAELSKNRGSSTKGFNLPNFSEPVADYFLKLSNIVFNKGNKYLIDIASEIEQDILGGSIEFNEQNKKLYFRQHLIARHVDMDLSFASSMVSEIAPIVAYFKYIVGNETLQKLSNKALEETVAASSSLIFIEEPEAHLHPEVQVKLMEFFARLTKHNVKVVMTSHSNYMFNKLSNLLLTNELEPEKVGSYLMRATPEGSVMDAFAMRAEEEGIADENFVDVAEQLYNERLEAYDKLNAKQ